MVKSYCRLPPVPDLGGQLRQREQQGWNGEITMASSSERVIASPSGTKKPATGRVSSFGLGSIPRAASWATYLYVAERPPICKFVLVLFDMLSFRQGRRPGGIWPCPALREAALSRNSQNGRNKDQEMQSLGAVVGPQRRRLFRGRGIIRTHAAISGSPWVLREGWEAEGRVYDVWEGR